MDSSYFLGELDALWFFRCFFCSVDPMVMDIIHALQK